VYVDVHYPLDVLVGALVGVAVGLDVLWIAARVDRRRAATALPRR
jgi:membrane-associated phospholipid phosphatase